MNKIIQDSVATGVKGIASTTKPNFTQYTSKFNGQDYDDAPHSIHQVDTYCGHRKLIRRLRCVFKEEYATTVVGAVSTHGNLQGKAYGIFNGVLQLEDGFEGFDYTQYVLSSTSKKFMTTQPSTYTRKWRSGDFGVLSFLNGQFDSNSANTNVNSQMRHFRIQTYNSSNTLLNTYDYQLLSNTIGGNSSPTDAGIPRMHNIFSHSMINGILSVGMGLGNIEMQNGTQSNVSYYKVFAVNSQFTTKSETITVQITDEDCKGLETIM